MSQLIQAVSEAQASVGVKVEYYRAVGRAEESRYALQLEFKENPVADEAALRLGRAIDEGLSGLNIEYEQKRKSGRLYAPLIQVMSEGWSSRRVEAKLARAVRDIQFKDELLGLPDGDDAGEVVKELNI